MAPGNKKHNFLSLNKKIEILNKLQKGSSSNAICNEYNIVKSTVTKIKKNESRIRGFVGGCDTIPAKRKTLKSGEYPQMEDALYKWFLHLRAKNISVSSTMLTEKAKQYHRQFYGNDSQFSGSIGWLAKFKERHGIRFLTVSGEILSNKPELVEPFLERFREKLIEMDLTREQIYNADETGLFWKQLHKKTMVHAHETTAPGTKVSKERVTFLACTNATGGHKVKPLVIGKAMKPRAFKNFILPVNYTATKNAWMTAAVFSQWFQNDFVPEVRSYLRANNLEEKALLLIDNAPSHPPAHQLVSEDGKICAMFLPPNCTALIQPMDQNAINITKRLYKKKLASYFVAAEDVHAALKSLNLRDCVNYLSDAWNELGVPMVASCFNKILQGSSCEQWTAEDQIPLAEIMDMEPEVDADLLTIQVSICSFFQFKK